MEHIEYIMFAGLIISLASMSGVALVKSHRKIAANIEKNLKTLSALSGGIFLVTSYTLGKESLHILGLEKGSIAFIIGIIMYIFLQKIVGSHRHIGENHTHSHEHNKKSAWKILIGDAIHNVADGLLLVASFGTTIAAGLSTALSISIHEVPQEISEFIVLKKSGYSTTEAAYKNFGTALSIFIGIGIGLIFLKTEVLQGYLLGMCATFFLGIIFTDLLPVRILFTSKKMIPMLTAFLVGVGLMGTISKNLSHEHENSDEYTKETYEHSEGYEKTQEYSHKH